MVPRERSASRIRPRGFKSSLALLPNLANDFGLTPVPLKPADPGFAAEQLLLKTIPYREDGDFAHIAQDLFSMEFYADKHIGYIDDKLGHNQPFFAHPA